MTEADGLGRYYESMNQAAKPVEPPGLGGKPRVDWSKYEGIASGSSHPRNLYAWATITLVGIYLLIAWATGIALLGIAPAVLSFRSWQKGESLAPLAVVLAVGSIILGFVLWPMF